MLHQKYEDIGKQFNLTNINKHGSLVKSLEDGRYYLNLECIMTWHLFKKIFNEIASLVEEPMFVSDLVRKEEIDGNPNFASYKEICVSSTHLEYLPTALYDELRCY